MFSICISQCPYAYRWVTTTAVRPEQTGNTKGNFKTNLLSLNVEKFRDSITKRLFGLVQQLYYWDWLAVSRHESVDHVTEPLIGSCLPFCHWSLKPIPWLDKSKSLMAEYRGAVAKWLERSPLVLELRVQDGLWARFLKHPLSLFTTQGMGTRLSSGLGKV